MPSWQHEKPSSQARGYGRAWSKLRKVAMDRDQWLCQPCKRQGTATPATDCDHVTPKAKGGTDALSNLQAICRACHQDKTQAEAAEAQGRTVTPRIKYDGRGFPIW